MQKDCQRITHPRNDLVAADDPHPKLTQLYHLRLWKRSPGRRSTARAEVVLPRHAMQSPGIAAHELLQPLVLLVAPDVSGAHDVLHLSGNEHLAEGFGDGGGARGDMVVAQKEDELSEVGRHISVAIIFRRRLADR